MKKLALVLGSLLVVGSVASAKEVMPAPAPAPEKVIEYVEKPVIVYRDREVTPAWRPNGSVDVHVRVTGPIENHRDTEADREKETDWEGQNYKAQLRTTASVNFTENQNLKIEHRNNFGIQRRDDNNKGGSKDSRARITHTYNFGNLGATKIAARTETRFDYTSGKSKDVQFKPVFDFSEYFFKNDYVKATALELGLPVRYTWDGSDNHNELYGVYANAEFDLPYATHFQAEFDNAYQYRHYNRTTDAKGNEVKTGSGRTGQVELTLSNEALAYSAGNQKVSLYLGAVYGTGLSYSKHVNYADGNGDWSTGEQRSNGSVERWGAYEIKFEPAVKYSYKATDFAKLWTRVGGEYKNRTQEQSHAKHWRWQPYARAGVTIPF